MAMRFQEIREAQFGLTEMKEGKHWWNIFSSTEQTRIPNNGLRSFGLH
jgi:hypothetical protein